MTIITVLDEVKENIFSINENFSIENEISTEEKETVKRKQIEIPEMKNIISEVKHLLDGLKIQMDVTEGNVDEFEDRGINIIQGEEQKEDWKEKPVRCVAILKYLSCLYLPCSIFL